MRFAAVTRVARVVAIGAVAGALAIPADAGAASVAYVDNGEVWLSSLDGGQKVRLATPVVNADGDTETWQDVAQADNGRIVAMRNKPGRVATFSWFKIWEPDGSSTVEGPLNAPGGWFIYVYPLGFDISANGSTLVYGYSNSSLCCPINFARGTYVRPATNSVLHPIEVNAQVPSLLGSRIVGLEDSSSPKIVTVQDAASPYADTFTPWLDATGVGLDLNGVDVAANGQLTALDFETWNGGTQTVGKVALISSQGVDTPPSFSPVDCFVPAAGIADDPSLSQDAATVAWKDDGGVKVAGAPTTAADPCVLSSSPVVISATGQHPSIGGADVTRFLPPATGSGPGGSTTPPPTGQPPTTPGPTPPQTVPGTQVAAPVLSLPAKLSAKGLASARGVTIKVKVGGPGKVTITGTVPAKAMGRRGKAVVVTKGRVTARKAGTVSVVLRFNAAARKRVRRLKGARLSLRVVQDGRSSTKSVTLR